MNKRLYRSRNDKMISGVCAGIAEYFQLDPTLIRLAFVLLTLAYGGGVIGYIVCILIIPEKPVDYDETYVVDHVEPEQAQKKTKQIIGIAFLGIGLMMFFDNFHFMFRWLDRGVIWSLGIIAVGGFLLLAPKKKEI